MSLMCPHCINEAITDIRKFVRSYISPIYLSIQIYQNFWGFGWMKRQLYGSRRPILDSFDTIWWLWIQSLILGGTISIWCIFSWLCWQDHPKTLKIAKKACLWFFSDFDARYLEFWVRPRIFFSWLWKIHSRTIDFR